MEAYPPDYVSHNLPLVVLSGLRQHGHDVADEPQEARQNQQGPKISAELSSLPESRAAIIRDGFEKANGDTTSWNGKGHPDRPDLIQFKLISTGRDYVFPQRKAAPPPKAPSSSPTLGPLGGATSGQDLHSPLSPLSPTSPLYPDGVLTPLWITKHQHQVPAVFLSFFEITADPVTASQQDSQLKTEISNIKGAIVRSGFKTRYAIALVADKSISAAPDLEDRLAGLRRATGLTCFFLPPPSSRTDIDSFVTSVLTTLQPVCIEYYRDLTKHARRKKVRGAIPPPTTAPNRGTSQTLSSSGWNVRYEFKQGVFAEFRREMDVAERHYSMAVEELFNPEGVLESTPSWSLRWEDARCLCDVSAIRLLRCLLSRGMTTGASDSWSNYRARTRDLIDRRGKGTDTYGWAAWESRWAEIMAQLISRASLPAFRTIDSADSDDAPELPMQTIYLPAEKAFSTSERLLPFHHLHHPGYWWRIAAKYCRLRRTRAEAIPDEDRTPPDQTPAALVSNRVRTYDTYMVPQPHKEVSTEDSKGRDVVEKITELDERSAVEFLDRRQPRAAAQARLTLAQTLVEGGKPDAVLQILRPLWDDMAWRKEGWWGLAGQVLQLLHHVASSQKDALLQAEVEWEMLADVYGTSLLHSSMWLSDQLPQSEQPAVDLLLDSNRRLSPVSVTFAFSKGEGNVGDQMPCQIVLRSMMSQDHETLHLSQIGVGFSGNPHRFEVSHSGTGDRSRTVQNVDVRDGRPVSLVASKALVAEADLRLAPGQIRVYNLRLPLRDADTLFLTNAHVIVTKANLTVHHVFSRPDEIQDRRWYLESDGKLIDKQISREVSNSVNVLPKPPKVRLHLDHLNEQFFTGETAVINVDIVNEEGEPVTGTLDIRIDDDSEADVGLHWPHDKDQMLEQRTPEQSISKQIAEIQPGESHTHQVLLDGPKQAADCAIAFSIRYNLSSDSEASLVKTITLSVPIISPFEVDYELNTRLHPSPWPSFFAFPKIQDGDADNDQGIPQNWSLNCLVSSFASEGIVVDEVRLRDAKADTNSVCTIDPPEPSTQSPTTLRAKTIKSFPLAFSTRKHLLEDRSIIPLDFSLTLRWHRESSSDTSTVTTTLVVPRITNPAPEPRVLCSTRRPGHIEGEESIVDAVTAIYTIENPSMHFLTFTLTMEASDKFAFSGPKFRTLSLTPMSRASVEYALLAYDRDVQEDEEGGLGRGRWIWPVLRVTDAYFQRALRVLDAGQGVKHDAKKGLGVWVPG